MTGGLVELASITLASSDSQIDFASIPGSYQDLYLVISPIATGSGLTYPSLRFNGDSSINYPTLVLYGNSAGAGSTSYNFGRLGTAGNSRTTPGHRIVYDIFDYAKTDKNKTVLFSSSYYGEQVLEYASRWSSNSAITSISIFFENLANFAVGSKFSLYGRGA